MNLLIIVIYAIVGFIAEIVDGTAGMAYGVTTNTLLRIVGIPSAISSACTHISELFTTGISGISHLKLKNINKKLFIKIVIPGVIGGVLGAIILMNINNKVIDIAIDTYLIIMGIVILSKVFKQVINKKINKSAYLLGFIGGFSDAFGGGGWGPVVTSTLIAFNQDVKETIGTVNSAEFFVTIAEVTAFTTMIKNFNKYTEIVLGLIIGGIIAAPIGAMLCKKLRKNTILILVGCIILITNIYKLLLHLNVI